MRRGSTAQIASDMGIRPHTVLHYLSVVHLRLGVATPREAVAWLDEHEPVWRDAT